MGDGAELLPGTLDLLILKTVSLGRLHGYGVPARRPTRSWNHIEGTVTD